MKDLKDFDSQITVILAHPENPENIGLVARSMKNTGFQYLSLICSSPLPPKAYVTAVHAHAILDGARFFSGVKQATDGLEVVFAATSKRRKNFSLFSLEECVEKIYRFPPSTRIGLLFGNERTGLTSKELMHSNFRFTIPQVSSQPSYNLSSAVLLTLFRIFTFRPVPEKGGKDKPLPREKQEECIQQILNNLKQKGFIHMTNRRHVTQMIYDLFGRIGMTEKDRRLLLALFSKGIQ